MKMNNSKKYYVFGSIIALIIIAFYMYAINKVSKPFDPIRDMRRNMVDNYEIIEIEKTNAGTMVYSVGKANKGADNMYFVDMVKRTLKGYKWIGGGGHVNHDICKSRDNNFIFSAQLLNEEQNINPTIIGVFANKDIKSIDVRTQSNKICSANIYDGKNEEERFYYISLNEDVCNNTFFIFRITRKNNERVEYIVSGKEILAFQEGKQIYFK